MLAEIAQFGANTVQERKPGQYTEGVMARKRKVAYAVMVNDEMYPDSLCADRDGAESYLGDAKHAAAQGANVRVVKLVIEELKPRKERS